MMSRMFMPRSSRRLSQVCLLKMYLFKKWVVIFTKSSLVRKLPSFLMAQANRLNIFSTAIRMFTGFPHTKLCEAKDLTPILNRVSITSSVCHTVCSLNFFISYLPARKWSAAVRHLRKQNAFVRLFGHTQRDPMAAWAASTGASRFPSAHSISSLGRVFQISLPFLLSQDILLNKIHLGMESCSKEGKSGKTFYLFCN